MISLCLLCPFVVSSVYASVLQDGSIHGKVLDPSGFVIPDVNIQIENTVLGAASNPDGSFTIQSIPYGTYTLVATHLRFEPIKKQITISGTNAVDITLHFQREIVILLDGVVVTATRSEKTPEKVPLPVVHISRSEVERRYQYNVGEMLDFVPGVRVIRSGGTVGAHHGISIRSLNGGSSSNKTLVLIDGRPINNGWDGGVNFNMLPTEMVERVEVVKGPSSALYGSQATAGVINIITRDVIRGFHGWLSIGQEFNGSEEITDSNADGYGRPDIAATNVQFNGSYRNEKSSHLMTVGYRQSGQSFITPTENKWDNIDLKYNLKHSFSEKLACRFHIDIHNNKWKNEAATVPNLENYDYKATDFNVKFLSKRGIMNGRIYMNNVHSKNESLQSGTKTGNIAYRIGFIGDYTIPLLKNRAFLKFGVDGYLDDVKVDYDQAVEDLTYVGVATVDLKNRQTGEVIPREADLYKGAYGSNSQSHNLVNVALFAQYEQAVSRKINVIVGGRLDNHSEFGSIFNPKLGVTYELFRLKNYTTHLKTNYGKGFRAPPMVGLFSKSLGGYGNPEMKPEKTENLDISIFQRFADWGYIEFSYFKMNVENLMINDKLGSTGWGYYVAIPNQQGGVDTLSFNYRRNLGEYSPSGFEAGMKIKPHGHVTLQGGYTFLDPEDFTFQTSKHQFNFCIAVWKKIGMIRLEAELRHNYTGKGYFFDYHGGPFDGFGITDLSLAFRLWSHYKVSFHAKNLQDTKYRLWHHTWQPGRTYVVRFEINTERNK